MTYWALSCEGVIEDWLIAIPFIEAALMFFEPTAPEELHSMDTLFEVPVVWFEAVMVEFIVENPSGVELLANLFSSALFVETMLARLAALLVVLIVVIPWALFAAPVQPAHPIIAGLDVVESARSAFADMPTELDMLWRFGCNELLADMTKFEDEQLFVMEL
jgi:hypothetical protein